MSIRLKGRTWFEFGQFNAQIPALFLVGAGQDRGSAIENLVDSFKTHVDSSVTVIVVNTGEGDDFILSFDSYSRFFNENLNIQKKAHRFNDSFESISTIEEYFDAISLFVPNAELIIAESQVPSDF